MLKKVFVITRSNSYSAGEGHCHLAYQRRVCQ